MSDTNTPAPAADETTVRRSSIEHRAGRLFVKMNFRDDVLLDAEISRAGDQRDDGAGYIRLSAEEVHVLYHQLGIGLLDFERVAD